MQKVATLELTASCVGQQSSGGGEQPTQRRFRYVVGFLERQDLNLLQDVQRGLPVGAVQQERQYSAAVQAEPIVHSCSSLIFFHELTSLVRLVPGECPPPGMVLQNNDTGSLRSGDVSCVGDTLSLGSPWWVGGGR